MNENFKNSEHCRYAKLMNDWPRKERGTPYKLHRINFQYKQNEKYPESTEREPIQVQNADGASNTQAPGKKYLTSFYS